MMWMGRGEREYLIREMDKLEIPFGNNMGMLSKFDVGTLIGNGRALGTVGAIFHDYAREIGARSTCGTDCISATIASSAARPGSSKWCCAEISRNRVALVGRVAGPLLLVIPTITGSYDVIRMIDLIKSAGERCAGVACVMFGGEKDDAKKIRTRARFDWMFGVGDVAAVSAGRASSGRSKVRKTAGRRSARAPRGRRV